MAMAILGLTVSESGESLQRLAVSTKVAIGEVVKTANGTRPNKLDHFIFLRKGAKSLDWEPDPTLAKHFGAECREVDIILLTDAIEDVFRTEYAWWTKTEKKCWGDGREATRRTEKEPDGEGWAPCGDGCPDLDANRCKPSGDLYFTLAAFPRLGSVCRLHTTSYRSVRQLHSALEQIRTVTGGRLAGIRCKLVVRPEKAAYVDAKLNKKVSTTIFALNLELRAEDMQKLVNEMTQTAKLFDQTKKLLGNGRKVEYLVEEEDEVERAPDVAQEFYPADEIAPAAPAVQQPSRAAAPPAEDGPVDPEVMPTAVISGDQRKKLLDVCVARGYSPKVAKQILKEKWGFAQSADITEDKYGSIYRYFASNGKEDDTVQRSDAYEATDEDLPSNF
jgi:hypothetical protein